MLTDDQSLEFEELEDWVLYKLKLDERGIYVLMFIVFVKIKMGP